MTLTNIGGYQFEQGYPLITTTFNDIAAVYVIYTNQLWLDIGETDQLETRISEHERRPCWQRNAGTLPVYVAVHPEANQQTRLLVESYLRSQLKPTCGDK